MAVIWGGAAHDRIKHKTDNHEWHMIKFPENTWSSPLWTIICWVLPSALHSSDSFPPCDFCHCIHIMLYICLFCVSPSLFPCPAIMLSSYFLCSTRFLLPTPFFLIVILSPCPSLYSCCQISLSTQGKLHISDYTPIKGPIGTQFACCSSSLETEKWTVSVCICNHGHGKKGFLKYYRLNKAYVRVCVCLIADGSPLLNPY